MRAVLVRRIIGRPSRFFFNNLEEHLLNQILILQPLMALFALVFAVWFTMFARHSIYLKKHGIDAQDIAMPERVQAIFPESVRLAGNNLRNLFELPVVFSAMCLCIYVTRSTDAFFLGAAWLYVALRLVHSLIHCTVNRVNFRFLAWFASCIVLWTMVARFSLSAFGLT
jgi:hypothetical protein